MRLLKLATATLVAALMLSAAPFAVAGSPKGVCQAGGYSQVLLGEMQRVFWESYVRNAWGTGGGEPATGRWFFIPVPEGSPISADPLIFQGSASFTVPVGKTLAFPFSVLVGESYLDGSEDPPDLPVDYKASSLLVTVDGRVIVDSTRSKLDCVFFEEVYFSEPIAYAEPTDYGADAAIYVTGLGMLLPPMSPGEHIIQLQVVSPTAGLWGVDVGYYNTWYVTVVKP
jgi:hypothetical protein